MCSYLDVGIDVDCGCSFLTYYAVCAALWHNKRNKVIIIMMMMRERLHTYSNAFLSCYNATTLCFCTTLCQLTCRTYDHLTFLF